MVENTPKAALQRGETEYVLWNHTGCPALGEAAVHAGWRHILIDTEHGPGGFETTINTMRAVECAGGQSIIRVADNDPMLLKRILDAGALSVMIPMVDTVEDAVRAARSCHYPPHGNRGYAPTIARASRYGQDVDYVRDARERTMVIVQIESLTAVSNIEAIADVDGIDMLFIGPNDLAGSMGKLEQLADPEFRQVMEDAEQRILNTGKWMGTIPIPGRDMATTAAAGHRLVAGPSDIALFTAAAKTARDTRL